MGVGTTALACLNLNRHYVGIELKQDYFDIAVQATEVIKCEKPNGKQVILA
jgi:site-specific DNA-methyltransferase (adenine-specific)